MIHFPQSFQSTLSCCTFGNSVIPPNPRSLNSFLLLMIHFPQSFQSTLSCCTFGNPIIPPDPLEHSFPEDLYTDPDPPAVSQLLGFAELGSFRLQLQQLSYWGFWHMARELVYFFPHHSVVNCPDRVQ